jgi:2-dehydro-3-deoxygalactonokinase
MIAPRGAAWLAVDWGTTNVRAWLVDGARVLRRREFALGVGHLQPGEAARHFRDTIRPGMNAAESPAILCGMIGSTLGWEIAPYMDCPVDLRALQESLHQVRTADPPAWIVPGLKARRPDGGPDVMRGEETQVFGWALGDQSRRAGEQLICLPGTHTKWVRMIDGRIESFVTVMTGELFALLRNHSVLRAGPAHDDDKAFALGLEAAGNGNALASRIFTARSRLVGGDMAPSQVESYLSGLLIGAEAASLPALFGIESGCRIIVVGERGLSERYQRALAARGFGAEACDVEEAVLAGLMALMAHAWA